MFNGQSATVTTGQCRANRGKQWVAADGSASTFITDDDVVDISDPSGDVHTDLVRGTLYLRDGRKFHFGGYYGEVDWILDRNGNQTSIDRKTPAESSFDPSDLPSGCTGDIYQIHDPLYRVIEAFYCASDNLSLGDGMSVVLYRGTNRDVRRIRIYYRNYTSMILAGAGYSNPQYIGDILPGVSPTTPIQGYNVSQISFDDGTFYAFKYSDFGEPAEMTLPTGAKVQYSWVSSIGGGPELIYGNSLAVLRKVTERREYAIDSTLKRTTSYDIQPTTGSLDNPLTIVNCVSILSTNWTGTPAGIPCTRVRVQESEPGASGPASVADHYFYGSAIDSYTLFPDLNTYSPWLESREFRTDQLDASASTVLKKKINLWEQRPATMWWGTNFPAIQPGLDSRVKQIDETLDNGEVSRKITAYSTSDNSNNPIRVEEYDYGTGSPGALLRATETSYQSDSVPAYASTPVHLRSLPSLVVVKNGSGGTVAKTQYLYDQSGFLEPPYSPVIIGYVDPGGMRGNVTSYIRKSPADVALQTTTATYDIAGNVRSVTNPNGATTQYTFGESWCASQYLAGTYALVTTITRPLSQSTSYEWDCNTGKQTKITSPAGDITRASYGTTLAQLSLDRITKISRDGVAYDLPAAGQSWQTATAETNFGYASTTDTKTYQDQVSSTDGAKETRVMTDGFGRPTKNWAYVTKDIDGTAITTQTDYDGFGRVKRVYNPSSVTEWTETTYDMLGRPVTITTNGSASSSELIAYWGERSLFTDGAGKKRLQIYDAAGRLTRVVEAPTSTVSGTINCNASALASTDLCTDYEYDALDNLTKVTQGGQVRDFVYNSLSQLLGVRNPEVSQISCSGLSGTWSTCYAYDANGNLQAEAQPGTTGGTVSTTFTYDALDRMTSKTFSDGTASVSCAGVAGLVNTCYQYDTVRTGCLSSVTNAVSTTSYATYGVGCQVLKSIQNTGTNYQFRYGYDLAGDLTKEEYPSLRTLTTSYDGAGRPTGLTGLLSTTSTTYASSFGYGQYGLPTSMTLGNGVTETRSYNSRLQAVSITQGSWSVTNCFQLGQSGCGSLTTIGTGNNGNVQGQVLNSSIVRKYDYDELNRLTQAAQTGGWTEGYGYDRYGNRAVTTRTSPLPALSGETPSALSAYSQATNRISAFGYDLRGNVTNMVSRTATYDADNHQTSVTPAGTGQPTYTYQYDGNGQRVKKTVGGLTTVYVYDAMGELVAEYGPTGSGGTQYVTVDDLGSTRQLTGSPNKTYDYTPFGEEIGVTCGAADGGPKFTGQVYDPESCLYYFLARMMSPAQGRFTSPDEALVDQSAGDPQSWNLYSYVRNNPLSFADPSGMGCTSDSPGVDCDRIVVNGDGGNTITDTDAIRSILNILNGQLSVTTNILVKIEPYVTPIIDYVTRPRDPGCMAGAAAAGAAGGTLAGGRIGGAFGTAAGAGAGTLALPGGGTIGGGALGGALGFGVGSAGGYYAGSAVGTGIGWVFCSQGASSEGGGGGEASGTQHGEERIAERKMSPTEIAEAKTGQQYTQSDGATAFVKKLVSGRYNVVIEGDNGIITVMKNKTAAEIRQLQRNYGWQ